MNALLHRRLRQRFDGVKIRNQGQERIVKVDSDPDGSRTYHAVQWGEQYLVPCPFCRDDGLQLALSYMYGQPDESGRQMLHLAKCFNHDCLKDYRNRRELAEILDAEDGLLEGARIRDGKVLADQERIPELPGSSVPIIELPEGHPARRYLSSLGFDPDKVGKFYDLHACPDSDDPLISERIIIPVTMRGKYQGWQSLATSPAPRSKQYLSAPGMRTSELIYNLDRARGHGLPVIVQEPVDVWMYGPMAMCALGYTLSERQTRTLRAVLYRKNAALLLPRKDRERLKVVGLRSDLQRALGDNLLVVEYGKDVPPGRDGRKALRELVARKARKRGFEANLQDGAGS